MFGLSYLKSTGSRKPGRGKWGRFGAPVMRGGVGLRFGIGTIPQSILQDEFGWQVWDMWNRVSD
jgi:hypothetical protein